LCGDVVVVVVAIRNEMLIFKRSVRGLVIDIIVGERTIVAGQILSPGTSVHICRSRRIYCGVFIFFIIIMIAAAKALPIKMVFVRIVIYTSTGGGRGGGVIPITTATVMIGR
jgi:hypothetical protein